MKFIEMYAKAGYAARAAVYALMGTFAVLLAVGYGGRLTDSRGAIHALLETPFGTITLGILALGLFAYAVWRIIQGIKDYDNRGTDWKGYFFRAGYIFGGIMHGILGYYALNLIFRLSRSSNVQQEKEVAQWALSQPFGQVLLGVLALSVAAFGIGQMVIAYRGSFQRGLHIPRDRVKWLCRICKFGLISRGVIFVIVSWLFMKAAIYANSNEARGVRGAWRFLADSPFGIALVAIVGVGLIAFAVYGITEAAYRDLKPAR